MKLGELVSSLEVLKMTGDPQAEISGIAYDSRTVKPGDLFVAWRGTRLDGRSFLLEALNRGAAALCVEEEEPVLKAVPCLVVRHARLALADLARTFYRDPARQMKLVGVTGTNGKTTVSFLLAAILEAAGWRSGLLGTIHYRMGDRLIPAERTTPESVEIYRFLSQMKERGCQALAMEVSSHALHQGRTRGLDFKGAVFTNLSQDHLDYHQDMNRYFQAKALLFEGLKEDAFAMINADDAWGLRLLERTRAQCVTYGFSKGALIRIGKYHLDLKKTLCELVFPQGSLELSLNLVGRFNLYNVLAAFATAWALGIHPETSRKALEAFAGVPGRMEFVPIEAPFQVVVDYAHTEDALRNVLAALRPLVKGRLISVFGCGGDRDRTKRSKMGEAAGLVSDEVIVTSDNSRQEEPAVIADEIEKGLKRTKVSFERILDRKAAIEFALQEARPDDLILIAGKGHEKFQEFGFSRTAFDDVAVVKEWAKTAVSGAHT